MYPWLLVGIGGFIGAVLRFYLSGWIQDKSGIFPTGTLAVNFLGCLFLGFIMFTSDAKEIFNHEAMLFLTIGILGAFTTMSTFSHESIKLIEGKEYILSALYIAGTVVLSLSGILLGKLAVDQLIR